MENIETLLVTVNEIIKKYEEIDKKSGKNFNIFSILEKNELELAHEKFIGELLNPKGSHNQGSKFLNLFLKTLKIKHQLKKPKVILEKVIDKNRRIDIVIEDDDLIIAIEMKVNATDQEAQLYDYYNFIKNSNKKKYFLYYLTPNERDADESSKLDLKPNKDYYLISFKYEIYEWIKECLKESCEIPILKEGINQYKLLLEKIFNLTKDKKDEIMEKIEQNIKAAHEIYSLYPDVWKSKIYDFYVDVWNSVYDNYGEKASWRDATTDEFGLNSIWCKDENCNEAKEKDEILKEMDINNFGIAFAKNLNENYSICVSLENYNGNLYFYIWISNFKSEDELCPEQLKDILELPKDKEYNALSKKIDNSINFLYKNNTNISFELFDKKQYKKIIENISNEMINLLKTIDKNLNKISFGLTI